MISIGNVSWPNPIGLAAGLIKGTAAFLDFASQGHALEIGSITLQPLKGNTGQTIWRYPDQQGLRHYAGMPNPGSEEIVHQLLEAQDQTTTSWGINIATSPGISDTDQAVQDISQCATNILSGGLKPAWLTLNVSSPDTQDAVDMLSHPTRVQALIQALTPITQQYHLPLWVKLSASYPPETITQLGKIMLEQKVAAIISTNAVPDTTGELGGWCGAPIAQTSLTSLTHLLQTTNHHIPVISVGGILSGEDVKARLAAGATATQIASALLLRGRTAAQDLHTEYTST